LGGLVGLCVAFAASSAQAAILRVPDQHATIQAAVDAAQAGDKIFVQRGSYCGAVLEKPVHLIGLGYPSIVGCETGPFVGSARAGFLLSGAAGTSAASGSTITGFHFDGEGVSSANLEPLGFGILGRFAHHVGVLHNRFTGTVQAVTNTAGDRWLISHNRIEDLSVFDCSPGGLCTGGDGIVVQVARGSLAAAGGAASPVNRPEGNWIVGNKVEGQIPDGFDVFGFAGVLVFAADDTAVLHNKISIPDNPNAAATGSGVVITNLCCGEPTPQLPGARRTFVAFNDASESQFGVVVEGSGGQNTVGLVLKLNRGLVVIEGIEQERKTRWPLWGGRHWKSRWM
jgi:hypothetical protein